MTEDVSAEVPLEEFPLADAPPPEEVAPDAPPVLFLNPEDLAAWGFPEDCMPGDKYTATITFTVGTADENGKTLDVEGLDGVMPAKTTGIKEAGEEELGYDRQSRRSLPPAPVDFGKLQSTVS